MSSGYQTVDYAPNNFTERVLLNNVVITGNLLVYGFTVTNTKASSQFVNVFDGDHLLADTAVPSFSLPVAAHNFVAVAFTPNGRCFEYGLVLCNSSTDATKTIGSADCFFDVQYDVVNVG